MALFNETPMLPIGFALPINEDGSLLSEATPTQDPYAAQRAQTEAALKKAYEAGPAAYSAEVKGLNAKALPWWMNLSMERVGTALLGLILIAAGLGMFGAKVVIENKGKIAKAAELAG